MSVGEMIPVIWSPVNTSARPSEHALRRGRTSAAGIGCGAGDVSERAGDVTQRGVALLTGRDLADPVHGHKADCLAVGHHRKGGVPVPALIVGHELGDCGRGRHGHRVPGHDLPYRHRAQAGLKYRLLTLGGGRADQERASRTNHSQL